MKKIVLTLALAGLTAPAFAQPAEFDGNWAAEAEWCVNVSKIGTSTPAPISINDGTITGYENTCTILEAWHGPRLKFWYVQSTCTGEGETYADDRVLMLDGPDILYQWFGDGEPIKFVRCKP